LEYHIILYFLKFYLEITLKLIGLFDAPKIKHFSKKEKKVIFRFDNYLGTKSHSKDLKTCWKKSI